jgi:hypothetical protein
MIDLAGLRHVRYVLADNPVTAGAFALFGLFLVLALFGPWIAAPLSVAVGLTLLASVSAYVLTGPRVAAAMAAAAPHYRVSD